MIATDQPTIFGDKVVVGLSSIDDGNMRFGQDDAAVRGNREEFLRRLDIDPLQATLVRVTYADITDFTRYYIAGDEQQGEGMLESEMSLSADALVAVRPDHALFLLLADCTGAVIYDPVNRVLMVSHLGRHSVEMGGAAQSINFLQKEFDSNPRDLLVWLSPAVGAETYPLHAFDDHSLHEIITEQLLAAGVTSGHIEASTIDTADSDNYFSHSEFKAGNRPDDGRFAIVAMMHE